MTTLIGDDGKTYTADTQEQVDEAIKSGSFKLAPTTAPNVDAFTGDEVEKPSFNAAQEIPDKQAELFNAPQEKITQSPDTLGPGEQVVPTKEPTQTLKNIQTGDNEEIPESQADKAILSGTHTSDVASLVGDDGKLYHTENSQQTEEALKSGSFRLSTAADREKAEKQKALEKNTPGPLGTAVLAIGNNPIAKMVGEGFNPPHRIIGGPSEEELQKANQHILPSFFESKEEKQAGEDVLNEAQKEHPIAYGVGAVAREIGTAALAGGAAKALTGLAGLGETTSLLSKAGLAKNAIEAATFAAPNIAQSLINKDPVRAAEDLAVSFGLNGAIHAVFAGANSLKTMSESALNEGESAAENLNANREITNSFAKQAGLTPAQSSKLLDGDLKAAAKKAGITPEEVVNKSPMVIQKLQDLVDNGTEIGKYVKQLDAVAGRQPLVEEALQSTKREIESTLLPEVAERKAAQFELKEAINQNPESKSILEEEFNKKYGPKLGIESRQLLQAAKPILERLDNAINKGTLEEAHSAGRWIWNEGAIVDNGNIKDFRSSAWGILKNNLNKVEDELAIKSDNPNIIKQLADDRSTYRIIQILKKPVERQMAKQLPETNKEGLSSTLNTLSVIGGLTAAAAHHPAGLIMLAARKLFSTVSEDINKKELLKNVNNWMQDTAPMTNIITKSTQDTNSLISSGVKNILNTEKQTAPVAKYLSTSSILNQFLPSSSHNQSEDKKLAELRSIIAANQNPQVFAKNASKVTEPLLKEDLPQVAEAYCQHQLRLMKVIQTVIPEDTSMAKAHPFSANVDINEISPATKEKYQRTLTIASDPTHLFELIKSNQITQGDVAIAAATNPSTLQKMRDELINEAMKSKPDLSYQQRLSVGIFMGQNIDESTDQVPVLQSVYAPIAPSGSSGMAGGKGNKSHMSAKSQNNITDSYLTGSQRAIK